MLEQITKLQQTASNPQHSVFVAASAGSGKTKILTDRVLRLLLEGIDPSKILCLTFTKVAAAQMQNRIYSELSLWVSLPENELKTRIFKLCGQNIGQNQLEKVRTLFAVVLDDSQGLKINTIHSFCQNLMKKFPIEAKINPNFQIIDTQIENKLLKDSVQKLLQLAVLDENLAKKVTQITNLLNENSFLEIILELINQRDTIYDLKAKYFDINGIISKIYDKLDLNSENYEKNEKNITEFIEKPDFDRQNLLFLAQMMQNSDKITDQKASKGLFSYINNPNEDTFEGYKNVFLTQKEEFRKKVATQKVIKQNPELENTISWEQERIGDLNEYINSIKIAKSTANLLFLSDKILEIYQDLKNQNSYLDYTDLITKSSQLLQNSTNSEWIRYKMDSIIEHVLIDESQDTNHYQWNIIKAISEDFFSGDSSIEKNRTIFVVGDEKQSIYSFQDADPKIFGDIYHYYQEKLGNIGQKMQDITLQNSFRSLDAILKTVDMVFSGTEHEKSISKLKLVKHNKIRDNYFGKVEIWPVCAIKKDEKTQEKDDFSWKLDFEPKNEQKSKEILAKIIAKTIKNWLDEGKILKSQNRPIKAGDIMILLKNRTNNLGNLLIKYLSEFGVGVCGSDKINLSNHIITQDLLALAKFILLPEDDLNLACLLKSPFIGIDENELLELCLEKNKREISLFLTIKEQKIPKNTKIYDFLTKITQKSAKYQYNFYEFYNDILENNSGRENILKRFGPQSEEIINQFLINCTNNYSNDILTLESFVENFQNSNLSTKIDINHQDFDEVKITTIHSAKGLEAPIVFLADTAHSLKSQFGVGDKVIFGDEEFDNLPLFGAGKINKLLNKIKEKNLSKTQDEYLRLLYVAMTRAEDELYVCGFEEKYSENCWYSIVKNAVLGHSREQKIDFNTILDEKIEKNHNFTENITLIIDKNDKNAQNESENDKKEQKTNKNAQNESENDKKEQKTNKNAQKIDNFVKNMPKIEENPQIIYPSEIKSSKNYQNDEKNYNFDQNNDKNLNFGAIIHKILEILPNFEQKNEKNTQKIEKFLKNYPKLTKKDKSLIIKQVLNIIESKDFEFLFSKNSQSEVPIIGKINGQTVSGKIDRLIINKNEIIIADYKTNQKIDDIAILNYKEQLNLYKQIIQKIYPEKTIKCAIIWTNFSKITYL